MTAAPPQLPPELWSEIFAILVHVPSLLDLKWDYSPQELIWEGWSSMRLRADDHSLTTRLTIIRVCRDWCRIGRRFVYEAIDASIPGDESKLDDLASLLERGGQTLAVDAESDSTRDGILTGYGRYVKRLEMGSDLFRDEAFPFALRLLKACHNIQIISLNNDGARFQASLSNLNQFVELVQSGFSHSLRRLSYWPPEMDPPLHYDLPKIPLYSATVYLTEVPTLPVEGLPLSLGFSSLSSLEIYIPSHFDDPVNPLNLPTEPIPALRYLHITGLTDAHITTLLPFMETNGPRLRGLRVTTLSACDELSQMLNLTTALESFVCDDVDLSEFQPDGEPSFPSITYIGLSSIAYERLEDVERIGNGFEWIFPRRLFPNLRVVRVLTNRIPDTLFEDWIRPIALAAEYGIRFEDRQRRLLSIPTKREEFYDNTNGGPLERRHVMGSDVSSEE